MLKLTTVALCLLLYSSTHARTWTSSNGKHTTDAKLIDVVDQAAVLKNAAGKKVHVPIRRLSKGDQKYIRKWLIKQTKQSSTALVSQQSPKKVKTTTRPTPQHSLKGQLFGEPFEINHIRFQNNVLTFQSEDGFVPDNSISIFLFLDRGESISGKNFRVSPQSGFGAPHVNMSMRGTGRTADETAMRGYSMNMQVSRWKNNKATVRILLSVPEHKTRLAGQFTIEKPFDPTALPTTVQRPHIVGKILTRHIKTPNLVAGYVGKTKAGSVASNLAGMEFDSNEGHVCCTTYAPRMSTIFHDRRRGLGFQHIKLEPGRYFVYVKWNGHCLDGEWINVKNNSEIKLTMKFDAKKSGSLDVTVPSAKNQDYVEVIALDLLDKDQTPEEFASMLRLRERANDGSAWFESLRPGKYRVIAGDLQTEVRVTSGDVTTAELKQ